MRQRKPYRQSRKHLHRRQPKHDGIDLGGGVHKPGTFYLRIDGDDDAGVHVAGKTDLIALYIHNRGLDFDLTGPTLTDPLAVSAGCGLFRLRDDQNRAPMRLSFMASDSAELSPGVPYGFVDSSSLTVTRCPTPMIDLRESPMSIALPDLAETVIAAGSSTSVHSSCAGYTGPLEMFGPGIIDATIEPDAGEVGWIKAGEYFTVYSFTLAARHRVTNGYLAGLSGQYLDYGQIMMEKLNP